jgi:hypothetical protein
MEGISRNPVNIVCSNRKSMLLKCIKTILVWQHIHVLVCKIIKHLPEASIIVAARTMFIVENNIDIFIPMTIFNNYDVIMWEYLLF